MTHYENLRNMIDVHTARCSILMGMDCDDSIISSINRMEDVLLSDEMTIARAESEAFKC